MFAARLQASLSSEFSTQHVASARSRYVCVASAIDRNIGRIVGFASCAEVNQRCAGWLQ